MIWTDAIELDGFDEGSPSQSEAVLSQSWTLTLDTLCIKSEPDEDFDLSEDAFPIQEPADADHAPFDNFEKVSW